MLFDIKSKQIPKNALITMDGKGTIAMECLIKEKHPFLCAPWRPHFPRASTSYGSTADPSLLSLLPALPLPFIPSPPPT